MVFPFEGSGVRVWSNASDDESRAALLFKRVLGKREARAVWNADMEGVMENYKDDPELLKLASSLLGWEIIRAGVVEESGYAVLSLRIRKGRTVRVVNVGVSGNLYDEAYFEFGEVGSEPQPKSKLFGRTGREIIGG